MGLQFLLLLISILPGLGLFWLLKYKLGYNLFVQARSFIRIVLSLIFANISYFLAFFCQALVFRFIVVNDKSYELSTGSFDGAFVSEDVANRYNHLSILVAVLTIISFAVLFIIGLLVRKKHALEVPINSIKNKSIINIALILLLLLFTLISLMMLALSSGFEVMFHAI
jgi:hypothetical protein